MAPVHVLGNPTGRGRNGTARDRVMELLAARGHEPVPIVAASRELVATAVSAAVAAGAERVVAVGGDGLVHLAVQALATTGVAFGVVPVGTGNDFARALGLTDPDLGRALDRALGPVRPLDLIRTDEAWIASVATVGFSVAVNARANRMRWPRGELRYTLATLLELRRLAPVSLTVEVDGGLEPLEVTLLAVANTPRFGGGMAICPDALPDDGLLSVLAVGPVGRLELLSVFPRVYRGTHVDHPAVRRFVRPRIRLIGAPDVPVWGDGEPVGRLPLELEAVPGALEVAAGEPTSPGGGGRAAPTER